MSSNAVSTHPWWHTPGFLAFDTETTGTDTEQGRIVTAAIVHFEAGAPTDTHEWLLKIDIPIPPGSTEVHGITDELSQTQGIDQREALIEIHRHLTNANLPIVAFNAPFDMAMLNANLIRHGPYVIDKEFDKYVKGRNQRRLMPTIQRYGLDLAEDSWHGAAADATITGRLFLAEMNNYDGLRSYTPEQLGAAIATWRDEQDASFQAWLAAKRAEEGELS
jgi:DNA polymerase-3 subunit epsilon